MGSATEAFDDAAHHALELLTVHGVASIGAGDEVGRCDRPPRLEVDIVGALQEGPRDLLVGLGVHGDSVREWLMRPPEHGVVPRAPHPATPHEAVPRPWT